MWIARDKDGTLGFYRFKPRSKNGMWASKFLNDVGFLGNDLFPEVTFENSPQEIELKIKTK
jgi:hypothetical protein